MEVIDRKFKFIAFNPCKGTIYTEKNAVVFCAQDKAFLKALEEYYLECEKLGCGQDHLISVSLLLDRVERYQKEVKSKIPDTETTCEIDRCIKGKLED